MRDSSRRSTTGSRAYGCSRNWPAITKDLTRVQNRIKGLYRSWAIPCAGHKVYSPRHRTAYLKQLPESGVQRRAARLYQQLDDLRPLRREARQELLLESHNPRGQQRRIKLSERMAGAPLCARYSPSLRAASFRSDSETML